MKRGIECALLVAAVLALYWTSLRYPLVFDDSHLSQYALRTSFAGTLERLGQLRWLSEASYGWVQATFGPARQWQRLANVLLHVGTVLAIFGFLSRLFAAVLAVNAAYFFHHRRTPSSVAARR